MKKYIFTFLCLFASFLNAEGFIAGTLVKTPAGYEEIQNIQTGDLVLSCDFQNRCVPRAVIGTFQQVSNGYLEIEVGTSVIGVSE